MSSETCIFFPPFRLDVGNEQLWRDTTLVPVRPKPFAVLTYLATHAGRLVARAEVVKAVWPETYVSEGLLRVYIREVRKVLGDDAETPRFIETIPRRGYRFLAAVVSSQQSVASRSEQSSLQPQDSALCIPQSAISLVGRDSELAQLHTWLGKALNGTRQVVFVTGEPGIGKTTVVDAFLSGIGEEQRQKAKIGDANPAPSPQPLAPVLIARGQCIEHYGVGEPYLPVLEALGQLCRQPGGEQIVSVLSRYAPTWLVQMPALVNDPELETLQRKVQGTTRERMLREMAEALEALTTEQPLVLVIEDLHWSDHATLDLLSLLAQRRGPARVLVLATYRPADLIVSGHPLKALKQELRVRRQCEEIQLGLFTTAEVNQYLAMRFPTHEFPARLGRILHQSTEGNPLFMVNVVDEWVHQEVLIETEGQWRLAATLHDLATEVPESLRQMIEKQLEHLTSEEQRVLETASVVGREFTTAAVAAGLEEQGERVEARCEGVAKRGQFIRALGTETLEDGTVMGRYGFLHALYQQVLYERRAAARRIQSHRRIGEWEERASGARVSAIAVELVVHFERGQQYERAIHYCYEAGQHARQRFATTEALQHFRHGLALLAAVPETQERQHHELSLLLALGTGLWGSDPELGSVYMQASELARQLDLPVQQAVALNGLMLWHVMRGNYQHAKEIGEQFLALTRDLNDPVLQIRSSGAMAAVMFHCGEPQATYELTTSALALYEALPSQTVFDQYGQNPMVPMLCTQAITLWLLGYPDQARRQSQAAVQVATEQIAPFGIVVARGFFMMMQQCLTGTVDHGWAEQTIILASEYGSHVWEGIGRILWGWTLVEHGQREVGRAQLHQGESRLRIGEGETFQSYVLWLLADAYGRSQQVATALTTVTEALTLVEKSGERFWEAELYRLRGELTLAGAREEEKQKEQGARGWGLGAREEKRQKAKVKAQKSKVKPHPQPLTSRTQAEAEAEACFLKAIRIAQQQQAKSLELRAVMSLVRLSQQQAEYASRPTPHAARHNLAEAQAMLSEVYQRFTEGFDTKDLQEAKELIASSSH